MFSWVCIVLLEINVVMLFYLKVSLIFLNVSQEFERTGMFFVLTDDFGDPLLAFYFLGFSFDDENNLVNENPLFYFLSSFSFYENGLLD